MQAILRRVWRGLVVLSICVLGAASAAGAAPPGPGALGGGGGGWLFENADAPGWFQDMGPRSLAVDADGHLHLAYGGDYLYYADYDGSQWHRYQVDADRASGRFPALALDSGGRPRIAFCDTSTVDLRYAYMPAFHYVPVLTR